MQLAALCLLLPLAPQDAGTQRKVSGVEPPSTIRVQVVDPEGAPLAGMEVATLRRGPSAASRRGESLVLHRGWTPSGVLTDEQGFALVEHLSPGEYFVAAGVFCDWFYATSDHVPVGASVELSTRPVPSDRVISGKIQREAGDGLQDCRVRFFYDDPRRPGEKRVAVDESGRFALLTDRAQQEGALLVSSYRNSARTSGVSAVAGGTRGLDITMPKARKLKLDVRNQFEEPVETVQASFSWVLGEYVVFSSAFMFRPSGGSGVWELPNVPFKVQVKASGHETLNAGPFDPSAIRGGKLNLRLRRYPSIQGRVVQDGQPVPDVSVSKRLVGDGGARGVEFGQATKTDEQGRFRLSLGQSGQTEFRAWSRQHGEGRLGPILIDPENSVLQPIEIEITEAPGTIRGKVRLPEGISPSSVWLSAENGYGYVMLDKEGGYSMPELAPGPTTLFVYRRFGDGGWTPVSTTTSRSNGGWIHMSHGPSRAPEWLKVVPATRTIVKAGQTVECDIDLTQEPRCVLKGRVSIDGRAPEHTQEAGFLYSEPGYSVALHHGWVSDYESKTEIALDGSFELHASRPGTYQLSVRLNLPGSSWEITDEVEIPLGLSEWSHDFPTGSLTVLPKQAGETLEGFSGRTRWSGPGNLHVLIPAKADKETRRTTLALVPAGNLELLKPGWRETTPIARTKVAPGESAQFNFPGYPKQED